MECKAKLAQFVSAIRNAEAPMLIPLDLSDRGNWYFHIIPVRSRNVTAILGAIWTKDESEKMIKTLHQKDTYEVFGYRWANLLCLKGPLIEWLKWTLDRKTDGFDIWEEVENLPDTITMKALMRHANCVLEHVFEDFIGGLTPAESEKDRPDDYWETEARASLLTDVVPHFLLCKEKLEEPDIMLSIDSGLGIAGLARQVLEEKRARYESLLTCEQELIQAIKDTQDKIAPWEHALAKAIYNCTGGTVHVLLVNKNPSDGDGPDPKSADVVVKREALLRDILENSAIEEWDFFTSRGYNLAESIGFRGRRKPTIQDIAQVTFRGKVLYDRAKEEE